MAMRPGGGHHRGYGGGYPGGGGGGGGYPGGGGGGYPGDLQGHQIPLGARVIAVSDAFDALTTDRSYRKGRSEDEAIQVRR